MKRSDERILTTHVGSLPRPDDLLALIESRERGDGYDAAALKAGAKAAVAGIVAKQVATGIDVVSDGEMSKLSYTFYVRHRLTGIGDRAVPGGQSRDSAVGRDLLDHPDFHQRASEQRINWATRFSTPRCIGDVTYGDRGPLEEDLANFAAAVTTSKPVEAFLNAASPGVLTKFVPNAHYATEDAYVAALAEAMQVEYEAIHKAGFLLQIDCPDLGSARHNQYGDKTEAEFLRIADRNIEAVNHATRNIPPDSMRLHICWGNYEGPHTHDIPLAAVLPVCMKARAHGFLFEGANPRHEHEWEDLAAAQLPDDKILIPGVIDSTTNFVEHPVLVAQRLERYAAIVGRERVIAGTDCGFATFAGSRNKIATSVVWSKLKSLVDGAAIASDRLWSRKASPSSLAKNN